MIERRRRPGFPSETLDGRLIPREDFRQELQGDLASEGQVLGEVHDAHAAAAEQGFDSIVADDVAGRHGAPMVLEGPAKAGPY